MKRKKLLDAFPSINKTLKKKTKDTAKLLWPSDLSNKKTLTTEHTI